MTEYTKLIVRLPVDVYNEVYSRCYCTGKSISVFVRDCVTNSLQSVKHYIPANDNYKLR